MKKEFSNPIPTELQAEVEALADLSDDKIDTSGIPEVQDWSNAKRGTFYRSGQKQVTLTLDADLIDWFRTHQDKDSDYRSRINRVLREYVSQQEG